MFIVPPGDPIDERKRMLIERLQRGAGSRRNVGGGVSRARGGGYGRGMPTSGLGALAGALRSNRFGGLGGVGQALSRGAPDFLSSLTQGPAIPRGNGFSMGGDVMQTPPPGVPSEWLDNQATYPTSPYVTDPTQGALPYGGVFNPGITPKNEPALIAFMLNRYNGIM